MRSRAEFEEKEETRTVRPDFDTDRCTCPVCDVKQQSSSTAWQCKNSHVVCKTCYDKMERKACPVCRVCMRNPIRPSFIDWTMGTVPTNCPNDSCDVQVRCADLAQHEKECVFATVACSHSEIGCTWVGNRGDENEHSRNCKVDGAVAMLRMKEMQAANAIDSEARERARARFEMLRPRRGFVLGLALELYEREIKEGLRKSMEVGRLQRVLKENASDEYLSMRFRNRVGRAIYFVPPNRNPEIFGSELVQLDFDQELIRIMVRGTTDDPPKNVLIEIRDESFPVEMVQERNAAQSGKYLARISIEKEIGWTFDDEKWQDAEIKIWFLNF